MAYSKRKRSDTVDVRAAHAHPEDVQRILEHLEENWKLYVGGAVFLVVVIVAGILFRISAGLAHREATTHYAMAVIEAEEPEVIIAELQRLVERNTAWTEEQLYLLGETAIRAEDFETAQSAFTRLREEYPQSRHVPDAAEGLAFLAENRGDLEAALAGYREIMERWPNTFAGRRQPYNIARVLEKQGEIAAAADAYQEQIGMFPGSRLQQRAETALARLHAAHPELVPELPEPVVTEAFPPATPAETPLPLPAAELPEAPAEVPTVPEPQVVEIAPEVPDAPLEAPPVETPAEPDAPEAPVETPALDLPPDAPVEPVIPETPAVEEEAEAHVEPAPEAVVEEVPVEEAPAP